MFEITQTKKALPKDQINSQSFSFGWENCDHLLIIKERWLGGPTAEIWPKKSVEISVKLQNKQNEMK